LPDGQFCNAWFAYALFRLPVAKESALRFARRLGIAIAALLVLSVAALLAMHHDGSVETDVWIDSPPQTVWKILTATHDYPRWNPEISRLDGALVVGNVIEFSEGAGPDAMVFHPTVLTVNAGRELKWKGFLWIPGLFDGEHRFQLEAAGNRTHFIQSERFSGILVGKLSEDALSDTVALMKQMNSALKARAEESGAH
jgi:hypothetical protein